MVLSGKNILITGGTGSFGRAFVKYLLNNHKPAKIIIYSRDEIKQWHMQSEFSQHPILRFFIGDVRDKDRLKRAMNGVDIVIHAAALKIVPTAEYNPFEVIKTNIEGAMNLVDACIDCGVDRVVALSTDKASSPSNIYGATKLVSDKVFIGGNAYSSPTKTKFSVVRYGNVMGSRGSVIPFFMNLPNDCDVPITDERMTRFMITLEQGVELVISALSNMCGGEIYVKKLPSMKIMDIKKACKPDAGIKLIGIRPGEKIHEQMIGIDDALYTYEYQSYFKILPTLNNWHHCTQRIGTGQKVSPDFVYDSGGNSDWMSVAELKNWIAVNHVNLTF